jgi:SAM-dependent methyltransferase
LAAKIEITGETPLMPNLIFLPVFHQKMTEKNDWFRDWFGSPYYRILYRNRDEQEARAFVARLCAHLEPRPGARMLDIACGEGRFAVQLAALGFDVTGIDLSHESIEKAKAQEHEHLQFFVHDMRFPFYINYFDYAFNFFTSFGYFTSDRDHLMAAKAFAAALKPGGTLVIDYLNREQSLRQLVPEETVQRGSYHFQISRRLERNHFIKDIRFTDADGRERHYMESVAAFAPEDFQRIFNAAGLEITETFGDYMLQPFDPEVSPRLIMILKKPYA